MHTCYQFMPYLLFLPAIPPSHQTTYDTMMVTEPSPINCEGASTMSFLVTVQQHTYHVDTEENGQQQHITLDGITHAIDWRHLAPLAADARGHVGQGGRYNLLLAGKSYDILVRRITRPE